MAAFLRDKIAFLDDAVRSQGVPAEHVLDAYVDTVASEEHHEVLARRLWPRVLDKIRKDTRVQRKQTLLHGRQVAHLYVCVCARCVWCACMREFALTAVCRDIHLWCVLPGCGSPTSCPYVCAAVPYALCRGARPSQHLAAVCTCTCQPRWRGATSASPVNTADEPNPSTPAASVRGEARTPYTGRQSMAATPRTGGTGVGATPAGGVYGSPVVYH